MKYTAHILKMGDKMPKCLKLRCSIHPNSRNYKLHGSVALLCSWESNRWPGLGLLLGLSLMLPANRPSRNWDEHWNLTFVSSTIWNYTFTIKGSK